MQIPLAPVDENDPDYVKLRARLEPAALRSTLTLAGLYQVTHELLKRRILHDVREFFVVGFDQSGMRYDDDSYRRDVLDRGSVPGSGKPDRFRGSVAWLVEMGAISDEQGRKLDAIYDLRHELTHDLPSFILDVSKDIDVRLFVDALTILRDVQRFWTQVEIDNGSFDDEEGQAPDIDDVTPLSMAFLQMCVDAYLEGLPES